MMPKDQRESWHDYGEYERDKEKNRDKRFMIVLLVGASIASISIVLAFTLA